MTNLGVVCPHCGASTGYAPLTVVRAVEVNPGSTLTAERFTATIYNDIKGIFYGVARCYACSAAYVVKGLTSSPSNPDGGVTSGSIEIIWPSYYRAVAEEIPTPVKEALQDASAALGGGSIIGAMLALRTSVIRALRERKTTLELEESSLKALVDAGLIARHTFEGSDVARRVANYVGHEEPDVSKIFTKPEAEEFYEYVDALFDELYVKPARIESYQNKLRGES